MTKGPRQRPFPRRGSARSRTLEFFGRWSSSWCCRDSYPMPSPRRRTPRGARLREEKPSSFFLSYLSEGHNISVTNHVCAKTCPGSPTMISRYYNTNPVQKCCSPRNVQKNASLRNDKQPTGMWCKLMLYLLCFLQWDTLAQIGWQNFFVTSTRAILYINFKSIFTNFGGFLLDGNFYYNFQLLPSTLRINCLLDWPLIKPHKSLNTCSFSVRVTD